LNTIIGFRRCNIRWAVAGVLLGACASSLGAIEIPASAKQAEAARIAAIAKARVSSVSVFADGGNGGGSGVVITPDGYCLTNFHVSKPAGDYMQCSMPDGKLYDAVIVGLDPTGDVALIKLLGRDDFPHATLADSDKVRVGDWCFAVGNPFLLATDLQPTVTWGIVSGVHRYQYPAGTLLEYADCIQTDAAINPGNSGGPLYDANGDLIGINGRGSFEKRGRVNVGVGYAISINQIKHFMGYLRSGRIVDHATLGASVTTDADGRVVVSDILDTSDAYRRGLRYNDEVVAFGGRSITTVNGFKNVLGIFPKGWRVPLSYRRDGQTTEILVRLAGVHSREELLAKVAGAEAKEAPPEEKPGEKPNPPREEQPKLPDDHPRIDAAKMPEHVVKVFAARTGYANYYFNQLNRDRIWSAHTALVDLSQRVGTWHVEAEVEAGGETQLTLDDAAGSIVFPAGDARIDLKKDLDTQLGPADSGGFLVAAALWRRMLLAGPQQYGEVYYQGTAPIATGKPLADLVDVLVATHDVTEANFLFEPATGRLVGIEMFPDPDRDPCEIYFGDFRDTEHGELPHRWEIRHGDRVFAVLKIKSFRLPPRAEKKA
jgi:S1-C subfamily serine protease